MAGSGGPWGGGGGPGDDDRNNGGRGGDDRRGGRRPGDNGPQSPEIDEIMKKGQEQLRVLMGGRGRGGMNGGGGGGGRDPNGPMITKQGLMLGALATVGLWAFMSFYTVRPEERSVELFLGEFSAVGNPGLNFAPWPVISAEIVSVTGDFDPEDMLARLAKGMDGWARGEQVPNPPAPTHLVRALPLSSD